MFHWSRERRMGKTGPLRQNESYLLVTFNEAGHQVRVRGIRAGPGLDPSRSPGIKATQEHLEMLG